MPKEQELLFKEEVYAIVGAAMEVHSVLGHGFLEAVYQEAMEIELRLRGLPFESAKRLRIQYKDEYLKKEYEADLLVFGEIIVELKATDSLTSKDESQLINYLNATGKKVGLLINFGSVGRLEWMRRVN
jgi:GxxExxY protein